MFDILKLWIPKSFFGLRMQFWNQRNEKWMKKKTSAKSQTARWLAKNSASLPYENAIIICKQHNACNCLEATEKKEFSV